MTTAQFQAADPAYSVWVSASAGTGKTTVLTARVLRLLLDGTNPGKILCLTYTKAGAAEMESRIKAKLCQWVTLPEEQLVNELSRLTNIIPDKNTLGRARKLFLETLDTPDGIKIQTIHSFCQGLMRRFPLEAGIVPHFKVMDDKTARELLKEARLKLLSDAEIYTPEIKLAVKNVFRRIREGTFSSVIESIINERSKLYKAINNADGIDNLKKAIFRLLEVPSSADEYSIIKKGVEEGNFDRQNLRECATLLLAHDGKTFIERGRLICNWLEKDEKGRIEIFNEYKRAFLTLDDEQTKKLVPAKTNIPSSPLEQEQARIYNITKAIRKTRLALVSCSMLDIAYSLLELYNNEKSGKAYLDYNDLITKAESLLDGTDIAPWVLYKLDGGIDHLLLDEAQDTSLSQWHIIDALCSDFFSGSGARSTERTIFVVGDEKQSIFSFQGAAPHIFNKMRQKFQERAELAGKKWSNIKLQESFRSAPAILSAVDYVRDKISRTSINSYETDSSPHIAFNKQLYGSVEIWPLTQAEQEEKTGGGWIMPLEYKEKQDTAKILAEKIAEEISAWIRNGRIIKSTGKKIRAGDIIILLRKRHNMADNIISSLKIRNIAVAGHDRLIITEHIAVMDLMALGNFLLLPEDSLSLACILKSPLIGFSEEDLFKIAYGRGNKSLWQSLKEKTEGYLLSPEGKGAGQKFQKAVIYLSDLLNKVDYSTPFNLYSYIIEATGGRKRFIQHLGQEINDPVDEFLSLCLEFEKLHPPSMQNFLNWLESGKSEIKRDMEQGTADAVRVMTVHGSKGLEAPIVIMPDTTGVPETKIDVFWHDKSSVMLWPGGSHNQEELCNTIKEQKVNEDKQEYYRLLYVAMTRAKYELYIAGYTGKKSRQDWCWYDIIYSSLSEIAQKDDSGILRIYSGNPAPLKEEEGNTHYAPPALPEYALNNPAAEPTPPHPLTPSKLEQDIKTHSPVNRLKLKEGRIIHNLLEFLPDIPEENRLKAGTEFLAKKFPDLDGEEISRILGSLLKIMETESLKPVFSSNSRAEVPVIGMSGDMVISGRIDRLAITDEKVIIVDYKTGNIPPQSVNSINKSHIRQMSAYKHIVQEIYPDKTIECYLIWTEGTAIFKLPQETADKQVNKV